LIRTAQTVLQKLGCDSDVEISITFVKDAAIKKLNKEYRGKSEPTDVLSFGTAPDFPSVTKYIGDVVISVDTAKRNAVADGRSLQEEVITLLVHGILHLAGYDHERSGKKEADKMMKKQRALLREVLP
jgi:probable rRNA maturation factor